MRIALFSDGKVGAAITEFVLASYPQDVIAVVTCDEGDIFQIAKKQKMDVKAFTTTEEISSYLQKRDVELGVLAWWPKIIKSPLLETPPRGFLNTHPSLLPYGRGKHPNFWALVEQTPFGVSLHMIDQGIDTGDVVAQIPIPYDWTDTGQSLYEKSLTAMIHLFRETYPRLRSGEFPRIKQDAEFATSHRAKELDPFCRIDLNKSYKARDLINLLRARTFSGHPSCWFESNRDRYSIRIDIKRD